jgi:hypothetical protein
MDLNDSLEEFEKVARVIEELGIEYSLGGSVASSVHGMPRGTHDIDVEMNLQEKHVVQFVQRLENDYIVTEEMLRDAIQTRSQFNLIPFNAIAKIDIFIPKQRPFDREAARRRVKDVPMYDGTLFPYYVSSIEDTVLRKLEWYRMTNETSDRQWGDVLSVLKVNCFDLDIEYLERWARELNVSDLLEKALDESGVTPDS